METRSGEGDAKRTRRRRGTGGGGRGLTTANSIIQHPAVSRFAPIVMAGAAVFYVVGSAAWTFHVLDNFGPLVRTISKTDTRYVVGPPTVEEAGRWIYQNGDTTTTVIYDGRDRAEQLHCLTKSTGRGACPAFMGVGIGVSEDTVWRLLGTPDRQQYFGETKVIGYDGLGIQFTLERFAVTGIAYIPRDTGLAAGQLLRMMTP